MVITGAADRAPEQIGSLIYVDAFMPENGQAVFDLIADERAAGMRKGAEENGEGWYMPPLPAGAWHVADPDHAAFLDKLSTHQPLACMTDPISHSGKHLTVAKKAYILASGYAPSSFPKFADRFRAEGWPVEEIDTHHFTMLSHPRETAELLIKHAA
jgi:hypothetical protein